MLAGLVSVFQKRYFWYKVRNVLMDSTLAIIHFCHCANCQFLGAGPTFFNAACKVTWILNIKECFFNIVWYGTG